MGKAAALASCARAIGAVELLNITKANFGQRNRRQPSGHNPPLRRVGTMTGNIVIL